MKIQLAALIAGTVLTHAAHGLEDNALVADRAMNDRLRPKTNYYSGAYQPARQLAPAAVEVTPPAPIIKAAAPVPVVTVAAPVQTPPRVTLVSKPVAKEPAKPAAPAPTVAQKPLPDAASASSSSNAKATDLLARLDKMDERRENVDSVIAHLKVVYKDTANKREFGLNGVYLADKNGNMRFRLMFSETLIADMVFRGETVEAWLPMKGKYLKGTRTEILNAGANDLSLLARVGHARELFFPRVWAEGATERKASMAGGVETIKVQSAGKMVRKVQMAAGQAYAENMSLYTLIGESLGELRYANYTDANSTPLHPGTITLLPAKGTSTLKMNVDEFTLNADLPVKSFELVVPDEQKPESLMQCLKEGKGIF